MAGQSFLLSSPGQAPPTATAVASIVNLQRRTEGAPIASCSYSQHPPTTSNRVIHNASCHVILAEKGFCRDRQLLATPFLGHPGVGRLGPGSPTSTLRELSCLHATASGRQWSGRGLGAQLPRLHATATSQLPTLDVGDRGALEVGSEPAKDLGSAGALLESSPHVPQETRTVSIYDTTLRDGAQMVGISLTVADKLRIARLLVDFGVDYLEGGWPGSNPKDAEFFTRWAEVVEKGAPETAFCGSRRTKLAAFGATRYKNSTCEKDANVQALLQSGAEVVTLVAKAWDVQVLRVLEADLEENLAMIRDTVAYFKDRNREVMLDAEHFFDGYAANREYAFECLRVAAEAGADCVVLCDTNGGTMPWDVEMRTHAAVSMLAVDYPHVRVGIHAHNDCDMAVANSLAAVHAGASIVQGCINGYGERTGNANLISVIGGLQVKMGLACVAAPSLPRLSDLSARVADMAGVPRPASQPFVGTSAFAHKGGIHVAAVRKMPESYNHMDPALVGNEMRSVVSELSGRGNIFDKAERAGLELDRDVAGSVLARIKQMENEGCAFENAGASVDMLIVRRGKKYAQPFQVLEFSVIASNRGPPALAFDQSTTDAAADRPQSRRSNAAEANHAMVKIQIGEKVKMCAAEGNGPVDALAHALRDGLEEAYPQLHHVELSDYQVRLLVKQGTMSTTRVTIDFSDSKGRTWTTVGAHTSIVEASFRALVDGLEFGIVNCSEDGCQVSS